MTPRFLLLLLAGCAAAPSAKDEDPPRLLALIGERLAIMPDVARWKWNAGKPIEDLEREKALLDAIAARAVEKGIDKRVARRFFQAQIEAAKLVQRAAFKKWEGEKRGKFKKANSLAELRKRIDGVTAEMIAELDQPLPHKGFGAVKGAFVTEAARRAATAPLVTGGER